MTNEYDRELFLKYVDGVNAGYKSNVEAYDKAILTLSSAGLALSLSFNKSLVPLTNANNLLTLKLTWLFFLISIVSIISSYMFAQKSLKQSVENMEKYYMEGKDEYKNKTNFSASMALILSYFAGFSFIAAIVCMVSFVMINV